MVDRGNVSANKCFSWVGEGSCGYFSILSEITESGGYTSGPGEVGVWYNRQSPFNEMRFHLKHTTPQRMWVCSK